MTPEQATLGGFGINAGASLIGGLMGMYDSAQNRKHQDDLWQKNYNAQKEFYQNSLQWRVADAKAAGLHPNVAAGGVASYTPSSYSSSGGSELGQAVSNIGRSGQAAMNKLADLQLEGQALSNQKSALDVQKQQIELENFRAKKAETSNFHLGKQLLEFISKSNGSSSLISLDPDSTTAFALRKINNGHFRLEPHKDSSDSEFNGEELKNRHFWASSNLNRARDLAQQLQKQFGGKWFATIDFDGSLHVYNREDVEVRKRLNFLDHFDYYGQKFYNWQTR